jgi:hypothetical protein
MLIPSGNNIARLLARWDAGTEETFVTKMNRAAAVLGMTRTTYTTPDAGLYAALDDSQKLIIAVERLLTSGRAGQAGGTRQNAVRADPVHGQPETGLLYRRNQRTESGERCRFRKSVAGRRLRSWCCSSRTTR